MSDHPHPKYEGLNPVKRLSHCYCHKLTPGIDQPGWFERLLMKLVPHFDIVKTTQLLCPNCVLECDFCDNPENTKATVIYLRRFYLWRSKWIGKNWGDLYLHHIIRSDDDPDPHDHPWGFTGFILAGGYTDEQWRWLPPSTPITSLDLRTGEKSVYNPRPVGFALAQSMSGSVL
jgi:hypothetical protein